MTGTRVGRHGNGGAGSARQPQVFARDLRLPDDAPLTYLERGSAEALRPDARAGHLVCPLPTCGDRRLTTRGGEAVRDHFAHRASPDGPHGYETLAHHTAKHLLGRHLRHHFPDAVVHVDDVAVDSGARPDVLLRLPNGREVAYEVQYAGLTPEHWQHRHERYAAEGLRDVWLFGGSRYQRSAGADGACAIGPTLAAVLRSGHPLLFIDSFEERVALGAGPSVVIALGGDHLGGTYRLTWQTLTNARWPQGVLELPEMREQLSRGAAHRQHVLKRQAQLEQARQVLDENRRLILEREVAWAKECAIIEQEIGSPLPSIVYAQAAAPRVPFRFQTNVDAYGQPAVLWPLDTQPLVAWRWRLLLELDSHLGTTVAYGALRMAVFGTTGSREQPDLYDSVLDPYLLALREAGYVWFAGTKGPVRSEGTLVLGGAARPPRKPTLFSRRVVVGVPPVMLVESPSGTVLWRADGEAALTRVGTPRGYGPRSGSKNVRTALLPGAAGQCGPLPGRRPP